MRRLLVLVVLTLAVVGCGGKSAAKPTPGCVPESHRAPCTAARVGIEYPFSVFTHCGVGYTYFDGRYWVIDPTQPGRGNSLQGFMTLVTRGLAQFRGARQHYAFKPAPPSFVLPVCY